MKKDKNIKFEQPSEALLLVNRYIIGIMGIIILSTLALGYFVLLKPKLAEIQAVEQTTEDEESRKLNNEKLLMRIKQLADEYEEIKKTRQVDLDNLKKMVPDNPQIAELFVMADRLASDRNFQLTSISISPNIEAEEKKQAVNPARTSDDQEGDDGTTLEKSNEEKALEELSEVYGDLKSLTVHLTLSKFEEVIEDEDGKEIKVSPYVAFKEYLSDLENNLRLIDIKSVSFGQLAEPGDEDDEEGDLGEAEQEEEGLTFTVDVITYYR
ncbi:hypothetical protein HOB10_02195 [Candidatus Parcubacteria bacterium]|jgi:hypothetical protein|nr:hypothetical protein [Candidatus Parcubacteria bacterium]